MFGFIIGMFCFVVSAVALSEVKVSIQQNREAKIKNHWRTANLVSSFLLQFSLGCINVLWYLYKITTSTLSIGNVLISFIK